jgi:hypothetical protein
MAKKSRRAPTGRSITSRRATTQLKAAPHLPDGNNGGPPCDPEDTPLASITGPTSIGKNQTVQLSGTAIERILSATCHLTTKPTNHSWSLFLKPPGKSETDVSAQLSGVDTLTPTFVANSFGVYRAQLVAGNNRIGTHTAEHSIMVFQPTLLLESEGKVKFLRVNEVGDSFGPAGDSIRVEAIVQLDTVPGKSFGFELRNDRNRPAHQGMLDLLRDAFANNSTVLLDYFIPEGNNNGILFRVALIK